MAIYLFTDESILINLQLFWGIKNEKNQVKRIETFESKYIVCKGDKYQPGNMFITTGLETLLPKGDYILVVSTYEPNIQTDFKLLIRSNNEDNDEDNDEDGGISVKLLTPRNFGNFITEKVLDWNGSNRFEIPFNTNRKSQIK